MEKEKVTNTFTQDNPVAMLKIIGITTYFVQVHFNDDATENMQDKIKGLLKQEIKVNAS